jgi:hypothetical protein
MRIRWYRSRISPEVHKSDGIRIGWYRQLIFIEIESDRKIEYRSIIGKHLKSNTGIESDRTCEKSDGISIRMVWHRRIGWHRTRMAPESKYGMSTLPRAASPVGSYRTSDVIEIESHRKSDVISIANRTLPHIQCRRNRISPEIGCHLNRSSPEIGWNRWCLSAAPDRISPAMQDEHGKSNRYRIGLRRAWHRIEIESDAVVWKSILNRIGQCRAMYTNTPTDTHTHTHTHTKTHAPKIQQHHFCGTGMSLASRVPG